MATTEERTLDELLDDLESGFRPDRPDKTIIAATLFDFSASMNAVTTDASGNERPRIAGAEAGFNALIEFAKSAPYLGNALQLGVGWFGDDVGFEPFKKVDDVKPPKFLATGSTPLGSALNLALDAIQDLVNRLDDQEQRFSIPNLCIVSDGAPDQTPELPTAVDRAAKLVRSGDLSLSLVGIDQADCDRLKALGLPGKSYCVADASWEELISAATLGGGATASQKDAV